MLARQIETPANRITVPDGWVTSLDEKFPHFDPLIEQGVLDIHHGETIGLVIETQCNYFAPLAFPQTVEAGIRVAKLGGSSVRYEVGLFAQGETMTAAAGHFVHVYVDRDTRRPVPVPAPLRAVLEKLLVPAQ